MSIVITSVNIDERYPLTHDALLVPTGYVQNPEAFDYTAVEIFKYFKASRFDIEILSTPEDFSTIELNSNIKRLGKFVVKDVMLPVFLGLMASFIYDNYISAPAIDSDPVSLKIRIEVVDSTNSKIDKRIDFEGTAEEFSEMTDDINSLIKNEDGI